MIQAQKIIKYLAIAFAMFLIVTITSAILSGIYGLASVLELAKLNENIITEDLRVISNEIKDIGTLKLELAFTDLEIKTGDTFKVETNNSKISFTESNGSVKIKEEKHNLFTNNNYTSNLIIYIPEDMIAFDEVSIDAGAGKIRIESLKTQGLYLNLGAGETEINNLNVTSECDIDGGAGKISILSGTINNLDLDIGARRN